jgi:hypothetical protein
VSLTPLPGLAELAENPDSAAGLPRETLCALLRTTRRLAAELEYHLALAPVPTTPLAPQDGQPDQRLSPARAAAYIGKSTRWLRGHDIPGKIQLGHRSVVYSERALAKYLRQRTAK